MTLSCITCGFVVGMLIGLTGVGGGSLMTPMLTILFGFLPSVAVGTDLAFASITRGSDTYVNQFVSSVNWLIVRRLSLGTLPAALIAALALKYFGVVGLEISKVAHYSIAISVSLTALTLFFKTRLQT
ncbi:MAG: sulfite exporter TauE/SafE family protein [Herbaspirillum sp.]